MIFYIPKSIHIYQWSIQLFIMCLALDYGLYDWGFESWKGLGIFFFITTFIPALQPTQPPIQWVPGVLSLGVK